MFNIGELVIYSGQGICRVDDICEKTYAGQTKTYYVLRPIADNHQLTISTPVDNEKTTIMKLLNHQEANAIIETFQSDGIKWIEKAQLRYQVYSDIVKTGNHLEIAKLANTLMRRKHKLELDGKKFYENDGRLLNRIQRILFKELSIALNSSYDAIYEKVDSIVKKEKLPALNS
jgi:CarD family transcriptional regulator